MTNQHTPTPWGVTDGVDTVRGSKAIIDEGGVYIGQLFAEGEDSNQTTVEKCRANAEFIVTCVNSHDELIEACKVSLARLLALDEKLNNTNSGRRLDAINKLQQALAKARGN